MDEIFIICFVIYVGKFTNLLFLVSLHRPVADLGFFVGDAKYC